MQRSLAALLVLTLCSSAQAESLMCSAPRQKDVIVEDSATRMLGYSVDCIQGSFVSDIAGCAPKTGFALSRGTGEADLVKIVRRWQDYGDHLGGVMSHYVTQSQIVFAAGFNSPDEGYHDEWSFTINRMTGEAILVRTPHDAPKPKPVKFSCKIVHQKF